MELLDQAIANTSYESGSNNGGFTIISENHDASTINWAAGLSDPGEMIACGYMPEARRQNGESDDAYQARLIAMNLPQILGPQRFAKLIQAAQRRAGLDMSNGRANVFVAGKAPWHNLGINVAEAANSADARRLAGIDWTVGKVQLFFTDETGTKREAKDAWGIVRQDTQGYLGNVGSRYEPIQNEAGFSFLDSVLGDFGALYESAGSLFGGKTVWMLVKLPEQRFTVGSRDSIEPYAIFTNSHDGKSAAKCFPTTVRTVCANTFRVASADAPKGISIRHTGNVASKINSAKQALGLAVDGFKAFAEHSQVMAATKLPDPKHYFHDFLDAVLDVTAADALAGADALAAALRVTEVTRDLERKSFAKKIERRGEVLDDILTRFESERCGINGARGSVWAAFNALTEWSDFGQRYTGSEEARESRRFQSVLVGAADEAKQFAYQQAMKLTVA